jgi:phosphohistidine phosphatase
MKTLFVLRHAAASGPGSAPTDFERPLNPRGRIQAEDIGAQMLEQGRNFEAVAASPARRVVETISGVLEGARSTVEPRYDPRAYNGSPETWTDIIRGAGDEVDRLLIVGHNPGLQTLLLHLAGDDRGGLREVVAASYSTATLAELSLAVDRWRDVGPRSGTIVSLVRPREVEG